MFSRVSGLQPSANGYPAREKSTTTKLSVCGSSTLRLHHGWIRTSKDMCCLCTVSPEGRYYSPRHHKRMLKFAMQYAIAFAHVCSPIRITLILSVLVWQLAGRSICQTTKFSSHTVIHNQSLRQW